MARRPAATAAAAEAARPTSRLPETAAAAEKSFLAAAGGKATAAGEAERPVAAHNVHTTATGRTVERCEAIRYLLAQREQKREAGPW